MAPWRIRGARLLTELVFVDGRYMIGNTLIHMWSVRGSSVNCELAVFLRLKEPLLVLFRHCGPTFEPDKSPTHSNTDSSNPQDPTKRTIRDIEQAFPNNHPTQIKNIMYSMKFI